MATFDLYYYYANYHRDPVGEEFPAGSLREGTRVWLDGIDGFFDQYFQSPGKLAGNRICFVPVQNDDASVLSTCESLDELPFVEALIVESRMDWARVVITEVRALGNWARTVSLSDTETLESVPESIRPSMPLISELSIKASITGSALWKPEAKPRAKLGPVNVIYVLLVHNEIRCMILTTNAMPSYLVRLEPESSRLRH